MKTNFKKVALLFLGIATFVSCNTDDSNTSFQALLPPTPQQFKNLRAAALANQTQIFQATAGSGTISLTSENGVQISLDGNSLTKGGVAATGPINIKFVEIFDKGTMLATNIATMGEMFDNNRKIMKSGGEFYIEASQGGVQLVSTGIIEFLVPASLTGGVDNDMVFWNGNINDPDNLFWQQPVGVPGPNTGVVGFNQLGYTVSFGNFGWTNIDRFINDPRPKTTLLATVPVGYTSGNSSVYMSVDGEGTNQLAKFDTYNPSTLQFSEHYGQIPIGLECHIIFATTENGMWRYAIKGVTTTANASYDFTLAETVVGTEAQMIAAINAIQ